MKWTANVGREPGLDFEHSLSTNCSAYTLKTSVQYEPNIVKDMPNGGRGQETFNIKRVFVLEGMDFGSSIEVELGAECLRFKTLYWPTN